MKVKWGEGWLSLIMPKTSWRTFNSVCLKSQAKSNCMQSSFHCWINRQSYTKKSCSAQLYSHFSSVLVFRKINQFISGCDFIYSAADASSSFFLGFGFPFLPRRRRGLLWYEHSLGSHDGALNTSWWNLWSYELTWKISKK